MHLSMEQKIKNAVGGCREFRFNKPLFIRANENVFNLFAAEEKRALAILFSLNYAATAFRVSQNCILDF